MTIPDYQTLMLPVLRCYATPGDHRVGDVADRIADELHLSEADRAQLMPSGKQRLLHNRVHWAKFYMDKAGLVRSVSRGRFAITDEGLALLNTKPGRIGVDTLMAYPAFRKFYKPSNDAAGDSVIGIADATQSDLQAVSPEERIQDAFLSMQKALQAELLERISDNTPSFFEDLIVTLLVGMGYGGSYQDAAKRLGGTGDGGVDGVINEDRLGLDRVYVQAKRYAASVTIGRPDVQGFVGSLVGLGATKGVFVTTSTFSGQARDYVKNIPQRVVLIDGPTLASLMIEHGVGVRTSQTITIRRLDEDFFSEET